MPCSVRCVQQQVPDLLISYYVLLVCLQEFDATSESEISIINRLAAERQDNLMWREYRVRLLRNMGLVRGRNTGGGGAMLCMC